MKRLVLLFPAPSARYRDMNIGYEPRNNPPQSGHGLLAACARRTDPELEVSCVSEAKPEERGGFTLRSREEMAVIGAGADVVGITCWFHNQEEALAIARIIKDSSPATHVMLGGHNVAHLPTARQIIRQCTYVDSVCYSKEGGERTIGELVRNAQDTRGIGHVPNIVYRTREGQAVQTPAEASSLEQLPLFDFQDTADHEALLAAHDGRRPGYASTMPRVGVFSLRGCQKAAVFGLCHYCTSATRNVETMPGKKFWQQIAHLWQAHGITDFFITDDIFPISIGYIRRVYEARKAFEKELPPNLRFRAYAYPDNFQRRMMRSPGEKQMELLLPERAELAGLLSEIGVQDIFFGVESFDEGVLARQRKNHYDQAMVGEAIGLLAKFKITAAIAIVLGLPGENRASVRKTLGCTRQLLERWGTKNREGGLGRIDVSLATPLMGTPWHGELARDSRVVSDYRKATGKELESDITPDYRLLLELSLRYQSTAGLEKIEETAGELQTLSRRYIREEMIGGFR